MEAKVQMFFESGKVDQVNFHQEITGYHQLTNTLCNRLPTYQFPYCSLHRLKAQEDGTIELRHNRSFQVNPFPFLFDERNQSHKFLDHNESLPASFLVLYHDGQYLIRVSKLDPWPTDRLVSLWCWGGDHWGFFLKPQEGCSLRIRILDIQFPSFWMLISSIRCWDERASLRF